MSVKVLGHVWDIEIPDSTAKFVLIAYVDHADHEGNNIFPSVDLIARKTGFSDRTIQRTTRKLEDVGLLIPDGKSKYGTNRWRYNWNWTGQWGETEPDRADEAEAETRRGDTVSPRQTVGVTTTTEKRRQCHQGGDNHDRKAASVSPEPSLEPSLKPSLEPIQIPSEFIPTPDQIKEELRLQMTDQTFQAVIRPLHFERRNGACVITGPPTDETRRCLQFAEHRLARQIARAAGVGELDFIDPLDAVPDRELVG